MNVIGISGLDRSVKFKSRHFPALTRNQSRIVQGLDSAAALVNDGGVIAAAAEERFSHEKGTGAFPIHAIRDALRRANLNYGDIDFVAHGFDYSPFQNIFGINEYLRKEFDEVYSPSTQLEILNEFLGEADWSKRFVPVPHHYAHAASAYHLSGFTDALVVVSDGMGEVDSLTVIAATGAEMNTIASVPSSHSLGVLYGAFTLYLGFCFGMDEYKVMGLAPYGNSRRYFNQVMDLVKLRPDGTYVIPALNDAGTQQERETLAGIIRRFEESFGPSRTPESEITQHHMDLAAAVQSTLEATQMHVLKHFRKKTGLTNLCLAGGVALNCTLNGLIKRSSVFSRIFVQPAAGDDGTALGAALYVHRKLLARPQPDPVRALAFPTA